MNTINITKSVAAIESNRNTILAEELYLQCSYGLEYIIAEIVAEVALQVDLQDELAWAGLDDLII